MNSLKSLTEDWSDTCSVNPVMKRVDRYTPEVCSQLRQIAESRKWRSWNRQEFGSHELLEDLELTYHLHIAAEASGARAGMAPMPPFPMGFTDSEGSLDPLEFINSYLRNRSSLSPLNQTDNPGRTELFQ